MLDVSLKTPRQGKFDFLIKAERIFEEGTVIADFNGFSVPGSVREKGFIAVEMKGSAEAKVTESEGLDRASFSELPAQLLSYSVKPLIFAYKYLRHPYRMVLDITKHKELPVISTVVDSASGITLFTEDGKLVHRLTYTVRNTWKQFMEVALPKDAELWGTYVDGKSVKPTKNEKEKILIPLNRSQSSEGGLAPFDVELDLFSEGADVRLVWNQEEFLRDPRSDDEPGDLVDLPALRLFLRSLRRNDGEGEDRPGHQSPSGHR